MKIPFYLKITLILLSAGVSFSAVFLGYNSGYFKQNNEQITQNSEPDLSDFVLNPKFDKEVKVDLSQQKMFLFESGKLVKEYSISSGLAESPTPTGEYKIIYKQEKLYSRFAGCWVSYWVGFTKNGWYGFHETPVCDGIREGEGDISESQLRTAVFGLKQARQTIFTAGQKLIL